MSLPIELQQKFQLLAQEMGITGEQIEEHFMRGSGHGGQKINKTASAVQLRHTPTGIEVKVQKFREQHLNRIAAYKLLLLKIEELKKGKESAIQRKIFKIKKQKGRRSRRSKERMLDEKHHRGDIKEGRKPLF